MIRVSNLSLPLEGVEETVLRQKAAKALSLSVGEIQSLRLVRKSVDARKKSEVHFVCTVDVAVEDQAAVLRQVHSPQVTAAEETPYCIPPARRSSKLPPVVVGMGPAGLFAALALAKAGLRPVVLERGCPVEKRAVQVECFWSGGPLDPQSNVLFGEGGAGTFSDGKLTTGTRDGRNGYVLEVLAAAGGPPDILWQHKPHVGTDVLRRVVANLRAEIIALGGEVRFEHRLTGLIPQNGVLAAITVAAEAGEYQIPCDALILAPGHSARDTFEMLLEAGIDLIQKPFALGVRIEHDQSAISRAQYGEVWHRLPPADYKLACHLPGGRSVFSFCVCPGGQVVAAAGQPGCVVTNGMSLRARAGNRINGGLLVGVTPADFGSRHPLAGVAFQTVWEEKAFALGGGNYRAPAQTCGDFLRGTASKTVPAGLCTYRPGVTPAELSRCLPGFVTAALREGIPLLDRKLRGFGDPAATLTGVETRSSSPVRILRNEGLQSSLPGLYPCGEGAGYAGGILSAAVDGLRVAEAVARGD